MEQIFLFPSDELKPSDGLTPTPNPGDEDYEAFVSPLQCLAKGTGEGVTEEEGKND